MPLRPQLTVERVRRLRAAASKAGLDIHLWSKSIESRRVRLLEHQRVGTVLDIGANEGQYASQLRRAGFSGRIVSFEPISEAFHVLDVNSKNDERWTVVRTALGDRVGETELAVSHSSVFSTTRTPTERLLGAAPSARSVRIEPVPLMTLDTYMAAHPVSGPLGVKIDVQGAEQDVLAGARATLTKAAFLELELPLEPVYEGQWTFVEAMTAICTDGFRPVAFENLLPDPTTGISLQVNVLFTRELATSTSANAAEPRSALHDSP